MIIVAKAYPRVGLIGNPSDGYFGKTIGFPFSNFEAEVTLYQTPELEILPNDRDGSVFDNMTHLVEDVNQYGYYGGIRLLKAAVKRFHDFCGSHGLSLDDRNFTIRYRSTIPHRVGLAGSSAIIVAGMRALTRFYGVRIPNPVLAGLVLSVETEELGISAGLQDRVVQTHQGLVYMDFDRALLDARGYGQYERIDPAGLPPLYVAYRTDLAEGSEVFHNDIRSRFNRGDSEVVEAMRYWAGLAEQARDIIESGRSEALGPLLDANFDRRRQIYLISEGNLAMVAAARSVGASAKFTGSGGAIVGAYRDEEMYRRLEEALRPSRAVVIRPALVPALEEDDAHP